MPRIIPASSPSSPVVVDVPASPSLAVVASRRRTVTASSSPRIASARRGPSVVHAQDAWYWACRAFDIQSSVRLPKPTRFGASGLLGKLAGSLVGIGGSGG